jgi:putative GTP pyrophosphokinase
LPRGLPDEDLGIFSIDDLLLRGLNAHNQEDFPLAVRIYSEILRRNPEASVRSLVHKHRGMAHFAQSMYEDAIGDFSNSLSIDERDYKAAYYRGVVRCVRQEYGEAISDFDRSIAVHPYNFFCLFRRSQAYYHQGDFPKALADCEAALCLEPEDSNANRLKGMVLEKLRM